MSKKGEFRQFHLGFWQSPDVEEMDPIEKLLYVYMITSPKSNMEGVYKTTLRRVSFETGIDRDMIPKLSARLEEKNIGGVFLKDSGTAWVVISSAPEFMPGTPQIKQRFRTQLEEWPQDLIDYLYAVNYQWPKWEDLEIPLPSESDPMPRVTRPSPDGHRGSPDPMPTRYDTDTIQYNTNTIHKAPSAEADASRDVSDKHTNIPDKQNGKDADTILYNQIKDAFLREQPGETFKNWGKEGSAIKQLIKDAKARSPDDPAGFIAGMIATYQRLRGEEAFFGKQPFTPSALNSAGIFDRVLNHAKQQYDHRRRWEEATA